MSLLKFERTKLIYLTYFNNFNNATKVDTPIIGDPVDYTEKQSSSSYTLPSYESSTMEIMGVTYPCCFSRGGGTSGGIADPKGVNLNVSDFK